MTKSHSSPPKMGNNGGTAFVRINGKRIYLGKFCSPEAAQNYARCPDPFFLCFLGKRQHFAASSNFLYKLVDIFGLTCPALDGRFLPHPTFR